MSRFESLVRPSHSSDVNENTSLLSEQVRADYGLSEDAVKSSPSGDLRRVLSTLESLLASQLPHFLAASDLTLVTDGQLPLRQSLLPEAQRKGLRLSEVYYRFHDLKKEFAAAFPQAGLSSSTATVEDMLNRKDFKFFGVFTLFISPLYRLWSSFGSVSDVRRLRREQRVPAGRQRGGQHCRHSAKTYL